ncbi:MAG: hypothetical protein EB071_08335 [Gammaproteobacteria bacterium]|nr:hypothetical protein [Gammaproteobacteria bacterium]
MPLEARVKGPEGDAQYHGPGNGYQKPMKNPKSCEKEPESGGPTGPDLRDSGHVCRDLVGDPQIYWTDRHLNAFCEERPGLVFPC